MTTALVVHDMWDYMFVALSPTSLLAGEVDVAKGDTVSKNADVKDAGGVGMLLDEDILDRRGMHPKIGSLMDQVLRNMHCSEHFGGGQGRVSMSEYATTRSAKKSCSWSSSSASVVPSRAAAEFGGKGGGDGPETFHDPIGALLHYAGIAKPDTYSAGDSDAVFMHGVVRNITVRDGRYARSVARDVLASRRCVLSRRCGMRCQHPPRSCTRAW
jgi:hypothetical protein